MFYLVRILDEFCDELTNEIHMKTHTYYIHRIEGGILMKTENPKTQREIPDEIEGKCKHIQIYIYLDF